MNPSQVPHRDWNLYYNHTLMNHAKWGIVSVQVNDGGLMYRKGAGQWLNAEAADLTCVWPAPRAINWNRLAHYICRRSRREARRSACPHHYYAAEGMLGIDERVLEYLCFPDDYPSWEFSLEAIKSRARESIAVTPEIILRPHAKGSEVHYRGILAGILTHDRRFVQGITESPATKRAQVKLQKEGILCL